MFNDKYGLTQAVLEGRKTMTRRLVPYSILMMLGRYRQEYYEATLEPISKRKALLNMIVGERLLSTVYQIGEEVAVAQAYKDLQNPFAECGMAWPTAGGWGNKMFVKAEDMPHRIRIIKINVEQLQDISEEDAKREGLEMVYYGGEEWYKICDTKDGIKAAPTAREAFSVLIDKILGKGTWKSNPWVIVYKFKLI